MSKAALALAKLQSLVSPTVDEIRRGLNEFSARDQIAAVAKDGGGNGGSQPGAVRWLGPCKTNTFAGQQIIGAATADGGSFRLSLGAQQTAPIAWNATQAQVIAALEALSNVGAGNVVSNPRWAAGDFSSSGYRLLFKDLIATAMLVGDWSGLTGPDAPYTVNVYAEDFLVEMFTPAVGDIIEDFFHVVTEPFDSSSTRLYYTDSTSNPTQNGPAWSIPNAGQGVGGLELDFDELGDFTNFTGLKSNPGQNGQPTSLLALIAHWSVSGGSALYTSLPASMKNAVPIYSFIEAPQDPPFAGEVWIWVKVSTPAPLMD